MEMSEVFNGWFITSRDRAKWARMTREERVTQLVRLAMIGMVFVGDKKSRDDMRTAYIQKAEAFVK